MLFQQLENLFFARDPEQVAPALLGKVICVRHAKRWLYAQIIETEAYLLWDKASHASLGYTQKRKALFMPPGTIYMYYARGGASLNVSCLGEGNAVLIKAAIPYQALKNPLMIQYMQKLNPLPNKTKRKPLRLCSGQTLLCKSLGLNVTDWDQHQFDAERFYIGEQNYRPNKIIQTTRLGIPTGRDENLLLRFIDYELRAYCTSNPLTKRKWCLGSDYFIHEQR